MPSNTQGVNLAGSTLRHSCHACALFRDREEEYSMLVPFAREGFDRGERLFQVVDAQHRPERLRRMADAGMASDEADPPGQVEVRSWEAAYLRGGRFNQDAMLELIRQALEDGKAGPTRPDAAGDARSRVIHDYPPEGTMATGASYPVVSRALSLNAPGVKPA